MRATRSEAAMRLRTGAPGAVIEEPYSLNEAQAAKYLGIAHNTLRAWRTRGESGPAYYRCGAKVVRYRKCDLDAWVESRMNLPLAE
jgi:predicted DNA-binding transcriptional regulator AlpA